VRIKPELAIVYTESVTQSGVHRVKAIWNGAVVAESENTVVVEGNHYFPEQSLKREFVQTSTTKTTCAWKGEASYLTLTVNGDTNPDAVWYYAEPKDAAKEIKGRFAFWKGVTVTQ
jgi:uncharacterized protein (DUF427 family)